MSDAGALDEGSPRWLAAIGTPPSVRSSPSSSAPSPPMPGSVSALRTCGFAEEAIAAGRREAAAAGLENVRFEVRDVALLDEEAAFDLITAFDAIDDQAKPAVVLANIADALRPDGTFLMVDIRASSNLEDNVEHPLATFLYTASTMHCMTVSLALDGDGLGTVWGEQLATEMLKAAGFAAVEIAPRRGRHRQQLLHRPQGGQAGVTVIELGAIPAEHTSGRDLRPMTS